MQPPQPIAKLMVGDDNPGLQRPNPQGVKLGPANGPGPQPLQHRQQTRVGFNSRPTRVQQLPSMA
eukprot:scaffold553265_cov51-Prasinocladus_malaysianus.AAC.5